MKNEKIKLNYLSKAVLLVSCFYIYVAYIWFFNRIPDMIHLTLWFAILVKVVYSAFIKADKKIRKENEK